ncbi:ABC transporter permease subunit [Candidatus Magnetaquicoccus inordinatus]|uniref:ABC transporter permease subunit n=1 Tax=Candidatus Magnetaquicoccus inordinatus TaxID=2496818 RepID=UPI00102C6870|nr:ABC transporter permease subunit [Candidatus Magnetaquicoccus inordinatus]
MRTIAIIAYKEIRDALRNRWIISATLLLAALAFGLAFVGSAPSGTLGAKPLAVIVVSLASLTIFLLPLISLMLAYDALVGEVERGTLLLLLTYPLNKTQLLLGKFIGHWLVLLLATWVGYGAAGLAVGWSAGGADAQSWRAFALLLGSSGLLGASFIAMAYLVSSMVRERGAAAGLAIAIWLLFVVLYDMGLLGVLIATRGQIHEQIFPWFLLGNPADIFRLLNLTAFEQVRTFAGLAGLSGQIPFTPWQLLVALLLWIVVPLTAAIIQFRRREP